MKYIYASFRLIIRGNSRFLEVYNGKNIHDFRITKATFKILKDSGIPVESLKR